MTSDSTSRRLLIVGILCIVLVGAFLRIWSIGEQSLWIDEGYTINAALSILEKGVPVLDSEKFYKNGVLSTYAVAAMMKVFPLDPFNPWQTRVPSAIAGIALAVMCFFLARGLFKDMYISCIALFLSTFSYWEIVWSRQARGYTLVSFFILVSFYFLWKYIQEPRAKYAFFALSILLLAYGSSEIAIVALPACAVILLSHLLAKKWGEAHFISILYVLAGISVALLFIPLELFPIQTSFYKENFILQMPVYLVVPFTLSVLGWFLSFFDKEKSKPYACLFTFIVLTTASIILYSSVTQFRYLFPVYALLLVASACAVKLLVEKILHSSNKSLIGNCSLGLALGIFLPFLHFVPTDTYWLERGSPQPDFEAVFRKISQERRLHDVVVSPYPQFHKIYLGEKGIWLKMNLNGRTSRMDSLVSNGKDYYVSAPVIEDLGALKEFLRQSHGYIIMDSMSNSRLTDISRFLRADPDVRLILSSISIGSSSGIWLYTF
jgi:hypothetical protein